MSDSDKPYQWSRRSFLGVSTATVAAVAGIASAENPSELASTGSSVSVPDHLLDVLDFGNGDSETSHDLQQYNSVAETGQFDRSNRVLQSQPDGSPGGSLSFTLKCDPDERTYLTVKFWGGDDIQCPLLVFDGQEVISSITSSDGWTSLEGGVSDSEFTRRSFRYSTYRLPEYLTEDSDGVRLRLVSWENTEPTRGLYRAYTHTDPQFEPPASEPQTESPEPSPVKSAEDPLIQPVIDTTNRLVSDGQSQDSVSPHAALGLSMAYQRDWIDSLDRGDAFGTVKQSIDDMVLDQAESNPNDIVGRGWSPHGRAALAFSNLRERFVDEGHLDAELADHPDAPITRREAYTQFFRRALAWRSTDRRWVTNQILIVAVALVRMSQALRQLDPERAPPQETVDRWIDEAVGLESLSPSGQWSPEDVDIPGFDDGDGNNDLSTNAWEVAGDYYTMTEIGSTKEPDWVADYGEHVDLITQLYELTGAERLRERAIDLEVARVPFRDIYDTGENRALGVSGTIGVRHKYYPAVGSLKGYSVAPLYQAMLLDNPVSSRLAELSVDHNKAGDVSSWNLDVEGIGSLERWIRRVDGYNAFQDSSGSDYRLPYEREEDFAWVDEDLGVVALFDGDKRLYANLGYHASTILHDHGVNNLARIHYTTPETDHLALVDMESEFPTNGDTWTRPNYIRWSHNYLGLGDFDHTIQLPEGETEVERAMRGEQLPQTSRPNGDPWPGAESWDGQEFPEPDPRVGMGLSFSQCRYGEYLIGINRSESETFRLDIPDDAPKRGLDRIRGRPVNLEGGVTVPPGKSYVVDMDPPTGRFELHTDDWQGYFVVGEETELRGTLTNEMNRPLRETAFELDAPDTWNVTLDRVEGINGQSQIVQPDTEVTAVWNVEPTDSATLDAYTLTAQAQFDPAGQFYEPETKAASLSQDWTETTLEANWNDTLVLPAGETTPVSATLTNPYPFSLTDLNASLPTPEYSDGWTIEATSPTTISELGPGESTQVSWDVTVPSNALAAGYTFELDVTYTRGNDFQTTERTFTTLGAIPTGTDYLSDLEWESASAGHSDVTRDANYDGSPLSIDGTQYDKGVMAHAESEIVYDLGGDYIEFSALAGINDTASAAGSCEFEVYGDGELLAETGVVWAGDEPVELIVNVGGVDTLRLVTTGGGDGISNDHSVWAEAQLIAINTGLGIDLADQTFAAGESTTVEATFMNAYPHDISGISASLSVGNGDGWTVTQATSPSENLSTEATTSAAWDVTVPSDTSLGFHDLTVEVSYDVPEGASETDTASADGTVPVPTGTYRIEPVHSGLPVSVDGASAADGADVIQDEWSSDPHQQWYVEKLNTDENRYLVQSVDTDLVMEVAGGSTDDGANVDVASDDGGDHQRWHLVARGDGIFSMEAVHSGKATDVSSASVDAGASIIQWPYGGGAPNRHYRFEEL